MPMFGVVCTKSYFTRQLVNCQFDYYLVCVQGQPGLKIRNRDLLQTRLDTTNSIAASEF